MSDLPIPLSSSPARHDAMQGKRSSPISTHAFLVHSPNTVANDLPPDVDNKPLARQKRRRTSKEDEEILKAEYLKNSKPDKAARMEIVGKVALGEKEVQIWFQNKRQTDRRRSRPIDSTSSTTLMSDLSNMSDPATDDGANAPESEIPEEQHVEPQKPEAQTEEAAESATDIAEPAVSTLPQNVEPEQEQIPDKEDIPPVTPPVAAEKPDSQSSDESIAVASTDPRTVDTAATELSSSQQDQPAQSRSSWISNRRSASFRYTEDYAQETITFPHPPHSQQQTVESPPTETTRSLKRAHSFVRLSMTDDGTARVITDADKTPSPPHAKSNPTEHSRAAAGLRRSYSAANFNERLAAASRGEPSPKIPRTSNVGRSRDSRAWEFWCDPDTRNSRSLTTRADQEGSGSAADAIGLLRANRRILGANSARQNTTLGRTASGNAGNTKKPRGPMGRASTAYGRLQADEKENNGKGKGDGSESDELPQTESDKENWEPEILNSQTPSQYRRQRNQGPPSQGQRQRQILGENTEIMSQSQSLGAMMARDKGSRRGSDGESAGSADPEQDEELKAFMTGSGRTSLSSAEEAGCVEGLLKLSQGNWK